MTTIINSTTTTHAPARRRTSPVKVNYLVDLAIFIAFLFALDPRSTGMAIHEWLGIAFGAAIVTHLLLHWKWLVASTRRLFGKLPWATRVNYILNTLLFVAMTIIVLSGIMMSEVALPALGIQLQSGGAWHQLHSLASDAALYLLALHVALHWKWIVNTTKRYVISPLVAPVAKRLRRPAVSPAPLGEEVGA